MEPPAYGDTWGYMGGRVMRPLGGFVDSGNHEANRRVEFRITMEE